MTVQVLPGLEGEEMFEDDVVLCPVDRPFNINTHGSHPPCLGNPTRTSDVLVRYFSDVF